MAGLEPAGGSCGLLTPSLHILTGACFGGPGPVTGETAGRWQRSAWYPTSDDDKQKGRPGDVVTGRLWLGSQGGKRPSASGKKRELGAAGGQRQQGGGPAGCRDQGALRPQLRADEAGQGMGCVQGC